MQPANKTAQSSNLYMQAREALLSELRGELLGPDEDPGILLIENPVTRYAAGMLFPADYDRAEGSAAEQDVLNDPKSQDEVIAKEDSTDDDENSADEITAALANSFFPSAMGLSFYCVGTKPDLKVELEYATYRKAESLEAYVRIHDLSDEITNVPEFSDNFEYADGIVRMKQKIEDVREVESILKEKLPKDQYHSLHKLITSNKDGAWIRTPHHAELIVGPDQMRFPVESGLSLAVVRKEISTEGVTLHTLALQNTNKARGGLDEDLIFFQMHMKISSPDESDIFAEYGSISLRTADEEDINLAMLYRNKKTYAVGHGCAANWTDQNGVVRTIETDVVPTHEVPQASFEIDELSNASTLQMAYLAGITGDREAILRSLTEFCALYKTWIGGLEGREESVPSIFSKEARKNIELCEEAHSRMMEGVSLLEADSVAFEAFQIANKAMLMQSLHSSLQKTRRSPGDAEINWPSLEDSELTKKVVWRPFQLAFILLSIKGTVDPTSKDRQIVDLIWFATGGGKTEAYLGLSAFTILYKRLKAPDASSGTTIMMRYTLRLLTAQQFQRACTLICALELIRKGVPGKLGSEEISIGLWVGGASTPNTVDDAEKQLNEFLSNPSAPCPSPVLSCPWCGTRMLLEDRKKQLRDYAMRKMRPKQIELFCKEQTCPFNPRARLPIKIVDEDIYEKPPTLLFGTVDKFAQMPRKAGVSSIFGLHEGGGPELIIQDELHLISGALGTMVALYETAVDFLSSRNGRSPKIIASTATVRRAAEQCMNLFGRESRQFPQPGLDIEDSFFSREDREKPGRMYVGVMPSGKTQTTASVRLTAKLLQSVSELAQPDEVKDKFWTLVAYFNSIRELGGFISLLRDDIVQYANDLRLRYGNDMRPIYSDEELTSRKQAEEIPQILEQLTIEYKSDTDETRKKNRKERPIDVVVATNMISVGVDIDRFGLMLVRGQPKMTSEYIQVSSRIGRRYPGMVVTLYNPARTRDRAHYERFRTYHGTFYRNVEPSSITPFSLPARIRALNAVLVTMARHALENRGINEEKGVALFRSDLPGLQEIKDFMLKRAQLVDPEEVSEVEKDIDRAWEEWGAFLAMGADGEKEIVYSNQRMGRPLLVANAKGKRPLGWIAPNSMRNVDAECNINIKDE